MKQTILPAILSLPAASSSSNVWNTIKDTDDHSFYFRYHHTAGDTISIMNPDETDSNVVGIASFLYIIADLDKTVRDVKLSLIHI